LCLEGYGTTDPPSHRDNAVVGVVVASIPALV